MVKRWQRLGERGRFQAVFSLGQTWSSSLVLLKGLPNGLEYTRYGFAVGKRLGNAVTRNRIKRRLREIVRQLNMKPGWDLIFVARQGTGCADYQMLNSAVRELADRARLLGEET